jgi:mycothiol synthase
LAAVKVLVQMVIDAARQADLSALLARTVAADGHQALPEPQRMALGRTDLGADGTRVLLAYDGADLTGCAVLSPTPGGSTALHVVIDPAHRTGGDHIGSTLIRRALKEVPSSHTLRLWAMRATQADDELLRRHKFTPDRDLLQMRVPIPLPPAILAGTRPVTTRSFRPGHDETPWLDINNRAFAGHPEQGGWTLGQLHDRLAADWVDFDGFLMADAPDGTGLIGSCWTKVVPTHPVLGEIYVISVDPDRRGQGWGRALTVAGLEWMAARGVTTGMLYTDASNAAALTLYLSLGFVVDHVDRSYVRAPK